MRICKPNYSVYICLLSVLMQRPSAQEWRNKSRLHWFQSHGTETGLPLPIQRHVVLICILRSGYVLHVCDFRLFLSVISCSSYLKVGGVKLKLDIKKVKGICGGPSGAGAGFLRVLRFPLPIFIPPIAPQSPSPIFWGWYNRTEVAAVQGT
jgi:hypothetical protein